MKYKNTVVFISKTVSVLTILLVLIIFWFFHHNILADSHIPNESQKKVCSIKIVEDVKGNTLVQLDLASDSIAMSCFEKLEDFIKMEKERWESPEYIKQREQLKKEN